MNTNQWLRVGAFVVVSSLVAVGCSDDSATSSTSGTTATIESVETVDVTTPATEVATTDTPDTADTVNTTDATEPESTDPVTTESATTEPVAPVAFDLTQLPTIIEAVAAAADDGSIAPLDAAEQTIGFPLAIPVPEGSTLAGFSAGLAFGDDSGNEYTFRYDAVAPGASVPDIDITLDDDGPGSVQIIEIWDPILEGIGFERTNSTASDPGEPGGPNSVNHVYVATTPEQTFNGIPGEVSPVFIWSDEDITGVSFNGGTPLGGYRVEAGITTAPDADVPLPLVSALLDLMPVPDGTSLSDADVTMRRRASDSFDADRGLTTVAVHLEWSAPAAMLDEIVAFYSTPQTLFDDPALFAGEEDFFADGTIVATELTDYDVAGKRLGLILLQRYGATLAIDPSTDGTEPMTISFDLDLDEIAPELALPS